MKHSDIAHYRQLTALKRNFSARTRRFPPVVEPAAMVDIALLVLLFFITSSSFVTRPGIRLTLPGTDMAEGVPLNAMVVTVAQENLIFFNNRRFTKAEDLRPAFERMRFEQPGLPLVIETEQSLSIDTNARIYHFARHAGIEEVYLATRRSDLTETP